MVFNLIMALLKLKSAPLILIEDDGYKNIIPLLIELTQTNKHAQKIFCYEQPVSLWKNIFKENNNYFYYEEFEPDKYDKYITQKCTVIVDSVNQMALLLGWWACLNNIKKLHLDPNVVQLILILHKDCLNHGTKLKLHLNHIASAVIIYHTNNSNKIKVKVKKSGKVIYSEEVLCYDSKTSCLKSTSVINKKNEPSNDIQHPQPAELSTFKIESSQIEQMEKYKLKLPYMSKINHGESKVYYEPDAVDDWDDEDPDDDLDI